jgi:hypothetical protein
LNRLYRKIRGEMAKYGKIRSFLFSFGVVSRATSKLLESSSKRAEILDLEVLNDALSSGIKNNSGPSFSGYGYIHQHSIFAWTVS